MKKTLLRINDLTMEDRDRGRLDHVSLLALEGEVISLIGLDYSGKDLISAVLSGHAKTDFSETDMYLDGKRVRDHKELAQKVFFSTKLGSAIGSWTVAEYILIRELRWIISRNEIRPKEEQLQDLADRLDLQVDCRKKMENLTELERRQVDVLKAVWRKARLLVIEDEFSGMTEQTLTQLGESIRRAAKGRLTVIVNSHSIMASYCLGEKYLIFQKGTIIRKTTRSEIHTGDQFNDLLLGKTMAVRRHALESVTGNKENPYASRGICVFQVNGLTLQGLPPADFCFFAGKVTACLVPDHKQRHQLYHFLNGRDIRERFQYMFREHVFFPKSEQDFFDRKIVSVENIGYPRRDSLMDNMSVADNLLLPSLSKLSFPEYLLEKDHIRSSMIREMEIRGGQASAPGYTESHEMLRDEDIHGRIRILLDRWLIYHPNVLIFFDPFLHCDNYGVSLVRSYIRLFAQRGTAVILIQSRSEYSEDIADEVVDISANAKQNT